MIFDPTLLEIDGLVNAIREEKAENRAVTREKNREVQRARIGQFNAIIMSMGVLSLANLGTAESLAASRAGGSGGLERVLLHLTYWIIFTTGLVVFNLMILSGQY